MATTNRRSTARGNRVRGVGRVGWLAGVVVVMTASLLSAVLLATSAAAYPVGFTSDNVVVASGAYGQVDIASSGDGVHLVYITSDGVTYRRSADRGSTWSSPVTLAASGTNPQVTATSNGTVYVAYSSGSDVVVRRSQDGGVSWNAGNYATLHASNQIQDLAITKNADAPALVCQHLNSTSGKQDVYWSQITAGTLTETKASHVRNSDENTSPRIAYDGSRYIVVWRTTDYVNQQDDGLWYRFTNLGSDAELVADSHITPGAFHNTPDVAWHGVGGQVDVSYVEYAGGGSNHIILNQWNGSSWSGGFDLYNAGSQQPLPRVTPCNGGTVVCRSADGQDVESLTGTAAVLMKSVNPIVISTCCESTTSSSYFAVASGGRILVKRSDSDAPTATGVQAPSFVNSNFSLSFSGVADQWNQTGTDPLGDAYTAGVTSIAMQYSGSQTGPWYNLSTDRGSTLDNAPWLATVSASGISNGTKYFRGLMTDTAGNQHATPAAQVVIDRTPPTCQMTTDSTPNSDGWRKATTITISGSDTNYDHCEYRIDGGSWTRYTAPFATAQGKHDYGYRALDKAGNSSGDSNYQTLWVDTVAPVCTVTKPTETTVQGDVHGNVFIAGQVDDSNLKTCYIDIDGREVSQGNSSGKPGYNWPVKDVSTGNHIITVRAVDLAGNTASASKTVTLTEERKTAGSDWYFAEGTTRENFQTYLCIQNPGKVAANVTTTYMLGDGRTIDKTITVPANSRTTVNVNAAVGAGQDVSTHVHSDNQAVIAERPMYFNYKGWTGGSDVMGLTGLQQDFYFAEGTTRDGFDEWLTLQNPNGSATTATVTYMLGTGRNIEKSFAVNPHTRLTVNVNSDVGGGQDVSTKVHSTLPIAAERPMYFNYNGVWTGGSTVVGAPTPEKTWYFAEGTTRDGFDEWLTIQNPGDTDADVAITYTTASGHTIEKAVTVGKRSRGTVNVSSQVGANQDVSTTVTANVPVVAERPMYFDFGGWTGGHDVLGANQLHKTWYFAEGNTRDGFNEFLTVLNPGDSQCDVYITYVDTAGNLYCDPAPAPDVPAYSVPEHSRLTINVKNDLRRLGPLDVSVCINTNQPCLVERPMYFDYNGWTGGHDVVGFPQDR